MSKPTLDDILNGPDELGILEDNAPQKATALVDDRIKAGFEEINGFVTDHGREPSVSPSADIREKTLAVKLQRIRSDSTMVQALRQLDVHALLPASGPEAELEEAPKSLDDILDSLDDDDEAGIFDLRHVRPHADIEAADHTSQRRRCPNFEKYRPLFERVNKELEIGVRKTMPFANEMEIKTGNFFILKGVMVYVEEVGEVYTKNGKRNARTKLIFANGLEGENLLRSLSRELYKDPGGRRISDPSAGVLFGGEPESTDVGTGTIYVLRSLSNDPSVSQFAGILHKIGVTTGSVERRIANAENDSTFLLAPVQIVATYELFNVNRTKLENLLHRFFETARADVAIKDRFGKPVEPREWFFVTPAAIRDAVRRLEDGSLVRSRYDRTTGTIIDL